MELRVRTDTGYELIIEMHYYACLPILEELFRTTALESLSKEDKIKYNRFMTTERDIRNQDAFARERALAEGKAEGKAESVQIRSFWTK